MSKGSLETLVSPSFSSSRFREFDDDDAITNNNTFCNEVPLLLSNGYASKHKMAFDLAHIEIHFKTLGQDIQRNYVAPYELVDNDQDLLFTPYMFKDALNE